MKWKVGLGVDFEGLICGPGKEESGFLCPLFRDGPSMTDHCGRRRHGSSSCLQSNATGFLFCDRNDSTLRVLSP